MVMSLAKIYENIKKKYKYKITYAYRWVFISLEFSLIFSFACLLRINRFLFTYYHHCVYEFAFLFRLLLPCRNSARMSSSPYPPQHRTIITNAIVYFSYDNVTVWVDSLSSDIYVSFQRKNTLTRV